MTGGQACEPGTARSTPTNAHSGREQPQERRAQDRDAAATRASSHVRRDAPCQSSAAK